MALSMLSLPSMNFSVKEKADEVTKLENGTADVSIGINLCKFAL
jgi:hypothetical protein